MNPNTLLVIARNIALLTAAFLGWTYVESIRQASPDEPSRFAEVALRVGGLATVIIITLIAAAIRAGGSFGAAFKVLQGAQVPVKFYSVLVIARNIAHAAGVKTETTTYDMSSLKEHHATLSRSAWFGTVASAVAVVEVIIGFLAWNTGQRGAELDVGVIAVAAIGGALVVGGITSMVWVDRRLRDELRGEVDHPDQCQIILEEDFAQWRSRLR